MSLFSDDARSDLDDIWNYLEERRRGAGTDALNAITSAASLLLMFPEAGRTGRVDGTREKVVARTPYLLVYVVGDDGAPSVLRVLHGRRRWPPSRD